MGLKRVGKQEIVSREKEQQKNKFVCLCTDLKALSPLHKINERPALDMFWQFFFKLQEYH